VYVPPQFALDDARAVLAGMGAADLVTSTPDGLIATFLPMLLDGDALLGHVARANPHWRHPGASMVIAHAGDAYVSPSWYASKQVDGKVVPTWNYVTVHVYGTLVVHDDAAWVSSLVRRLTERHETGGWSVDDAPPAYIEAQLRGIVGVALEIIRIEGKAKLS
jgi:transcriptional regulator